MVGIDRLDPAGELFRWSVTSLSAQQGLQRGGFDPGISDRGGSGALNSGASSAVSLGDTHPAMLTSPHDL